MKCVKGQISAKRHTSLHATLNSIHMVQHQFATNQKLKSPEHLLSHIFTHSLTYTHLYQHTVNLDTKLSIH
jgi:hypothetical protein